MQTITTTPQPTATDELTTVRRFFAAWAAGDAHTMAALVDPNAVIEPVPGLLYSRPLYYGRDGVVDALHEIAGRWERFEMRLENVRRVGDDILAVVHVAYEKHGMSCDVEIPVVCALRAGLIFSVADDAR